MIAWPRLEFVVRQKSSHQRPISERVLKSDIDKINVFVRAGFADELTGEQVAVAEADFGVAIELVFDEQVELLPCHLLSLTPSISP